MVNGVIEYQAPVRHAITRWIWGRSDAVLLVFGGAAAEFALNRAVDWLFVRGDLPRDPIGRLLRTVGYAQAIAYSDAATAHAALARIRRAHAAVEAARGASIPAWAHRAVLYMLIDYSERAATVLRGRLRSSAQQELYADFRRIGEALGITALPPDYPGWREDRARQLEEDLVWSPYTAALYAAYRRTLGPWRYAVLRQAQAALVPPRVRHLLRLPAPPRLANPLAGYRILRRLGLGPLAQRIVVPPRHWTEIRALDRARHA